MTGYTQPHTYSAAYSAMPLRVFSSDVNSFDNLKYTINVTWNKVTSSSATAVTYNNQISTKFTISSNKFEVGDSVFLDGGTSNPQYTDYYNVLSIPNSTEVILNLQLGAAIVGVVSISNVIKYKMSPDKKGEAKLDISNTIKDFVSQNLEDTNEIFEGPDTRFEYELFIGEEYKYIFEFEDNGVGQGGKTFFNNSTITSLSDIPFQIGDSIKIHQYEYEWNYNDNLFVGGNLAFSGNTNHDFLSGQIVTVTGQITEDYYNGPVTVASDVVTNSQVLKTNKTFTTSTPAEGGVIFGIPRPTYNTVAQITNIYIDNTLGLVIQTNIPFAGNSNPLPGQIKFADDRATTFFNKLNINSLNAFNSHINRIDYSIDAFDKYVIQNRASSLNNFSTLLENQNNKSYRIEQSTKSWLLAHTYHPGYFNRARFYFYDKTGAIISVIENKIPIDIVRYKDFYFPVGIDQLIASTNTVLVSGSNLSSIKDDVDNYNVALFDSSSSKSEYIKFDLNDDCSKYEIYHLMWKDRYGSWLSYPFKYVSKDTTEFERKTFYKKDGKFNLTTNDYGYDSFGRGEKSYFGRSRDKITLNSGWLEEFENVLIKDLLESTSVYVQTPDNTLIGCIIENKSFEFMKENNVDIFQYKLSIRLSTNETRI